MKRYLLFGNSTPYYGGGWNDFVGSFNTIDEAKGKAATLVKDYTGWYHIIDLEILERVAWGNGEIR